MGVITGGVYNGWRLQRVAIVTDGCATTDGWAVITDGCYNGWWSLQTGFITDGFYNGWLL